MLRNTAYQAVIVDLLSQSGECGIVEEVFDPFEKVCTALFHQRCNSLIKSGAYEAEEQIYESNAQGYFQYAGTEHVSLRYKDDAQLMGSV
jgi:hypothetical protein